MHSNGFPAFPIGQFPSRFVIEVASFMQGSVARLMGTLRRLSASSKGQLIPKYMYFINIMHIDMIITGYSTITLKDNRNLYG